MSTASPVLPSGLPASSPGRSTSELPKDTRTPSPSVLRIPPDKEKKLEARMSSAPGSRSQVGFDISPGDNTSSLASYPGQSLDDAGSRGRESSSRSKPAEVAPTAPPTAAMAAPSLPLNKETSSHSITGANLRETTSSPAGSK